MEHLGPLGLKYKPSKRKQDNQRYTHISITEENENKDTELDIWGVEKAPVEKEKRESVRNLKGRPVRVPQTKPWIKPASVATN